MRRNLPSPTALLAFEASARFLSFKRAADELNVSPAAVSRQIRNLEDYTGKPLFRRLHRRVELTAAGVSLFGPVRQGFEGMATSLASLREMGQEQQVTVGASVGFAFFWLMPRLGQFSEIHPEITVNQVVADDPIDMLDGPADLAIRYGAGQWPDLDSRYLYGDLIYPVCSPSYLETVGNPETIADLSQMELIDIHGIPGDQWLDWATWFRYVGHRQVGIRRRFLTYLIGIQMALDGQGCSLGWHSFVGDLVIQGRLVKPLDVEIRSPGAFFLTTPVGRSLSADSSVFAEWLVSEAKRPG